MKNLKESTSEFLNEVKSLLDNSTWNFEACNPSANYNDCYKATNYLDTQKFSIKKITEALNDCWEDYRNNVRDLDNIESHEDCVKLAAGMISSTLAASRISRYSWSSRFEKHTDRTWYIDETVTFTIN